MTAVPPWYAVFGQPISHSRSPRIHQAFAAQSGQELRYERIECAAGQLQQALNAARAQGLRGANITLPLKSEAFGLCQGLSLRARRAGAVNTLLVDGEHDWYGDNTDGAGLMQDLIARQQLNICGQRILLLGAGGAAAGVLPALLELAPAVVCIANRTFERARELADRFGLQALPQAELATAGAFDLVVNASAAGHHQHVVELPVDLLDHNGSACDLSYGPAARPFLDWAERAGAKRKVDGLGMLVEQAALAYALWHGVRPQTEPVYQQLRRELA